MKIIFGKYIFRDSLVHNFDGRFKIISYILLLTLLFLKIDFIVYFFLLAFFLFIFFLSKLPKIILYKIMQTVSFLFIFLFLINLIDINTTSKTKEIANDLIWNWSFLSLKYSGIVITFYYSLRVFLVILITVIFISTIKPKVLTLSIENLLKPLQKIRFPTHIFSMIISLTLRLVPTLIEEANNIMAAQASRGLDLRNSTFKNKLKALISLLIPLIISIFKRADEMATAMESRGYNPLHKRTKYQQFILARFNFWVFFIVCLFSFMVITYLYWMSDILHSNSFILNEYITSFGV